MFTNFIMMKIAKTTNGAINAMSAYTIVVMSLYGGVATIS